MRFPLTDGPWAGADLLVWTTTPWTLPSNTAVAVARDIPYVRATAGDGDDLVVAEDLLAVLGEDARVTDRLAGSDLLGSHYRRPLDLIADERFGDAHRVVHGDHVTTDAGTGLVHMAPAFGAEDHLVAKAEGLEMVNPIGPDGHFYADVPLVGGMFFKGADPTLVDELRARGVLWRSESYEHSYPHCWRCHTPLIYYALPSWFIRTTEIRDRLVEENERTNWYPPHIKHGRYGGWLENNVDWALSRNRYWGTPLPIWRNDADPVGDGLRRLARRARLAGRATDLTELDPHRPFVDDVTFPAPSGTGTMRRVTDVIDVWYDSGAMPFAQWGAPHHHEADFEQAYPAQYICEAIDQTRGWFYSLMAVGTLVFDRSSYENVVCLGLLLDEQGRKMSKHLGNVLDPFELFDSHGADAVRWLMLAQGSPWVDRRVGHEALREIVRKVLLTYWNTASFLVTYANASGWRPTGEPVESTHPMDRWVLGELAGCVREVTRALDDFDSSSAGRAITSFVDGLSNWYVRRSRRRFWAGEPEALATLHHCVETLSRLMAPFTPFTTDHLWTLLQGDVVEGAPDSVHLTDWPVARRGRDRPRAGRPDGARAPDRRARPVDARRQRRAHPPAPGPRRRGRERVRRPRGRPARRDRRGAQRRARRGGRRGPRRGDGQAELPGAGQAVREADPGRGGGGQGLHRHPGGRHAHRRRRRRGDHAVRRRDPGRGEPARGLGGPLRGRPVGRSRHRAHRRAARRRARPRRRARGAGGPQDPRARGVRPDRPHLDRRARRRRRRGARARGHHRARRCWRCR